MMTEKVLETLKQAKLELRNAESIHAGINIAKERMKNILYNYKDELIEMAVQFIPMSDENRELREAQAEDSKEINALRKKLAALEASSTEQKKAKPKE